MAKTNTGGVKAPATEKIIPIVGLLAAEKKRLAGYKVVEVKKVDGVKTYFMEVQDA